MSVNLSELYQASNIPITAEDFTLRKSAFDAATEDLSDNQLVDCCRIYYGWWEKSDRFSWFLTAFQNDPRFSFSGNRREASVLAGGLLLSNLEAGNAIAGLATVSASVQGTRPPVITAIPLSTFENHLRNLAVEESREHQYDIDFKALAKVSITKEKIAEDNSAATMAAVIMNGFTESHGSSKAAINHLQTTLSKMASDLSSTREQLAILWWLTGGWSRKLKKSFTDVGSPLAFVVAGFDLADLTYSLQGPFASDALLARVLTPVKKPRKPITLGEVADAPSEEDMALLELPKDTVEYADICPLSASLLKSSEIGKGNSWHAAFEKAAHLSATTELSSQQLALQAMYERLLLTNL